MRLKLIGVCLAFIATATTASAADYNWEGLYAGVNAGASFSDSEMQTRTSTLGNYFATTSVTSVNNHGVQKVSPTDFTGGVGGGYNVQRGHFVFGLEADFNAFDAHDSKSTTAGYPGFAPSTYTLTQSVDTDWIATVRPRVGYTTGQFLFYGTGGIAVTDVQYKSRFTDNFGDNFSESSSKNSTELGWIAGAGIEYALQGNWTIKGEYLYTDFGSQSSSGQGVTNPAGGASFSHAVDLNSSIIRVGLNYQF